MRRIVMTLLVCLLAGAAQAGPIYDVQTGGYTEGDWVLATGIVTADPYNGVCLAESPYTAYLSLPYTHPQISPVYFLTHPWPRA